MDLRNLYVVYIFGGFFFKFNLGVISIEVLEYLFFFWFVFEGLFFFWVVLFFFVFFVEFRVLV